MTRRIARTLVLLVALFSAGCSDDDETGPGTVTLTVDAAAPLGAAVLDLRGGGIEGVDEPSGGWAVMERLTASGGEEAHRLLVVQEQAGDLTVRVRVADVDAPLPTVTVLQASGADDRSIASLAGIDVRVRR